MGSRGATLKTSSGQKAKPKEKETKPTPAKKTVAKQTAKPKAKPVTKAKPVSKPAAKPAKKTTTKSAAQATAKPASKAATAKKEAAKIIAKSLSKVTAAEASKTSQTKQAAKETVIPTQGLTAEKGMKKHLPGTHKHFAGDYMGNIPAKTKAIAKETGLSSDKSQKVAEAITNFTNSSFYVRSHPNSPQTLDCELYIEKARPYKGTTYRGVKDFPDSLLAKLQPGYTGNFINCNKKGEGVPTSWSSSKSVAESFSGWQKQVVFINYGETSGVSIKHLSELPGEKEVLCSGKAKHRVKSRFDKGNITYVVVEEI